MYLEYHSNFANHSIFQYVNSDFRFYVYQENRVIGSQHVPNKETKLRGSVKSHIKFMMYKVSIAEESDEYITITFMKAYQCK